MNLRRTVNRYNIALAYNPAWGVQLPTTMGDWGGDEFSGVVDDLKAAAGALVKPATDELRSALKTITILSGIAAAAAVLGLVMK